MRGRLFVKQYRQERRLAWSRGGGSGDGEKCMDSRHTNHTRPKDFSNISCQLVVAKPTSGFRFKEHQEHHHHLPS